MWLADKILFAHVNDYSADLCIFWQLPSDKNQTVRRIDIFSEIIITMPKPSFCISNDSL